MANLLCLCWTVVNTPAVTTNTMATMIPLRDPPQVYTTSRQSLPQRRLKLTVRTTHPVQDRRCAPGVPLAQTGPEHPGLRPFLARSMNGPISMVVHDLARPVPGMAAVQDVRYHLRRYSQHRRHLLPDRIQV